MTSVPATIKDFIKDLDTWDIFKNIKYKTQEEFENIDTNFKGICFVSTEYLKIDTKKQKKQLKKLDFDACIFDESDFGSSTEKTKEDIINFTKILKENLKLIYLLLEQLIKPNYFIKYQKIIYIIGILLMKIV